jgi:hypothetical protein
MRVGYEFRGKAETGKLKAEVKQNAGGGGRGGLRIANCKFQRGDNGRQKAQKPQNGRVANRGHGPESTEMARQSLSRVETFLKLVEGDLAGRDIQGFQHVEGRADHDGGSAQIILSLGGAWVGVEMFAFEDFGD